MVKRQDSAVASTNIIEPLVTRSQIEKIVVEECKSLRGTSIDVFFPRDSFDFMLAEDKIAVIKHWQTNYSEIEKRLNLEASKYHPDSHLISTYLNGPYEEDSWSLRMDIKINYEHLFKLLFFENIDFEVGEPILEYRPYAVKFPNDSASTKRSLREIAKERIEIKYEKLIEEAEDPEDIPGLVEDKEVALEELGERLDSTDEKLGAPTGREIRAKDLVTGKTLVGVMNENIELNGFASTYHHVFEGRHPIPTAIGIMKEDVMKEIGEVLTHFKRDKNMIVRKPKKIGQGEPWYFPCWEIPITSKRRAVTYFQHRNSFIYEHSAIFTSKGAVSFEGFRGARVFGVLNNSDFDLKSSGEIGYKVRRITGLIRMFISGHYRGEAAEYYGRDLREELFSRFVGDLRKHRGINIEV